MNYLMYFALPKIGTFLCILGILGTAATAIGVLCYIDKRDYAKNENDEEEAKKFAKKLINLLTISISLFFVGFLIPKKYELMQLRAIPIIQELKGVEKIPQKLIDKLNDLLDEKNHD